MLGHQLCVANDTPDVDDSDMRHRMSACRQKFPWSVDLNGCQRSHLCCQEEIQRRKAAAWLSSIVTELRRYTTSNACVRVGSE